MPRKRRLDLAHRAAACAVGAAPRLEGHVGGDYRAVRRAHPRALAELCAGKIPKGPLDAEYCLDGKHVRAYFGARRIVAGRCAPPPRLSIAASPNFPITWLRSLDMDAPVAENLGTTTSSSLATARMPYVEQSP